MGRTPDVAALQGLVAVAKSGSISGAARALGQPKQSVSRRILALEEGLGMRLFERTTRSLRLTAEGKALSERADHVLAELAELQHLMASHAHEPEGPLRVSVPSLFGQALLGPVIARYVRRYPKVDLEIDVSDRRVDLVEEGYDAAIRVGAVLDTSLIKRRIATSRSILVASPGYFADRDIPASPADLAGHLAVLTSARTGPAAWSLERGSERCTAPIGQHCQVSSLKLALDVVAAGSGIALVPAFLAAEPLRRGEVMRVLADWRGGVGEINLVHPSRRLVAPRLRAFVETLVEYFPEKSLLDL